MSLLSRQAELLMPECAREVISARNRDDEVFDRAQDGLQTNGLARAGRSLYFHSRYSPGREAERLAATVSTGGLAVVVGIGMTHHIREIDRVAGFQLVVEPDPALVRSALAHEDVAELLATGRVQILTGESTTNLLDRISREYVPAIHRTLSVVALPGRVQAEPRRMGILIDDLTRAVERLKNDLAVQVRFGHQWNRNAILNLPRVRPVPLPHWSGERVTVCAAGPSLEDFCASFKSSKAGRIVSVDSALPVLIDNRIEPDLVVTVDCQVATYHHFLLPRASSAPLVADLSVSPAVFRASKSRIAGLSDHPLHRLIAALGLDLPYLDVRGGNVAQAAVDVAVRAGAGHVSLVGADFSFPEGRTYARGSYIDRHFQSNTSRTTPLATKHYRFLVERPGVHSDPVLPTRRRQPILDHYARSMANYAAAIPVPFTRVQGPGIPLPPAEHTDSIPTRIQRPTHHGRHRSPAEILARMHELVSALSSMEILLQARSGTGIEALAANALLPLLTRLRSADSVSTADDLLAQARKQTLSLIRLAQNQD